MTWQTLLAAALDWTRDIRDVLTGLSLAGIFATVAVCVLWRLVVLFRRVDIDEEPVPDNRAMDVVTDAMRPERWQDEACAMTAPDDQPIVPRPQPDISSAAQRYGAEVEAYLKEFSS